MGHDGTVLEEEFDIFDVEGDILLTAEDIALDEFEVGDGLFHALGALFVLFESTMVRGLRLVEEGLVVVGDGERMKENFFVAVLLGFLGKGGVTSIDACSSSSRDSAVLKSPSLRASRMILSFSLIMLSAGLESG